MNPEKKLLKILKEELTRRGFGNLKVTTKSVVQLTVHAQVPHHQDKEYDELIHTISDAETATADRCDEPFDVLIHQL